MVSERDRLDEYRFMIGTLLGAEEHKPQFVIQVGDRRVDEGFGASFDELMRMEGDGTIDLWPTFRIAPFPEGNESAIILRALVEVSHAGVLERTGPEQYQVKLHNGNNPRQELIHRNIPGRPDTWHHLGGVLLSRLQQ